MEKSVKKQNSGISFFKIFAATLLALFVFWFLLGLFWIFMLVASISSQTRNTAQIKAKSVLLLRFDKPIVEHNTNDFKLNFLDIKNSIPLGLDDILKAIDNARTNKNISGIFLDLDLSTLSLAEISEIREALLRFKTSGKFIIAHSDIYTQPSYYLATAADKIYISPTGSFIWKGLTAQLFYYKSALDKLGIEPVIIRHGKYKSAVEPFMQDTISSANRKQISVLLNSFWYQMLDTIAKHRSITPDKLNLWADSLTIATDDEALKYKLVDDKKTYLEVIAQIKNSLGLNENDKLNLLTVSDLMDNDVPSTLIDDDYKIAVIFAQGGINLGTKYIQGTITSDYYAKLIRNAANDTTIKAIVLRVNSPGGSALASEVIYRELIAAKQKKPVVVSMGHYAASGGYYISVPADFIMAEPYTITGSIGVFGLFFNFNELLQQKLGVSVHTINTNSNSDALNFFKPPTYAQKQYIRRQIEQIYQTFVEHVANNRDKSIEYVDSIAQGRVWSATDALRLGLIDQIGTLNDAIKKAANIAAIGNRKYQIIAYPRRKNFLQIFSDALNQQVEMLKNIFLGKEIQIYDRLKELQQMQGIQSRMLYEIKVE